MNDFFSAVRRACGITVPPVFASGAEIERGTHVNVILQGEDRVVPGVAMGRRNKAKKHLIRLLLRGKTTTIYFARENIVIVAPPAI